MNPTAGITLDGLDANNKVVSIQEGEGCDLTGAFKNGAAAIAKVALATVTATLYDESTSSVINSRDAQDILDANGMAIDADGAFTFRLQPADNVLVGSPDVGEHETHILRIAWTWDDGVLVADRTGIQEIRLYVQKLEAVS